MIAGDLGRALRTGVLIGMWVGGALLTFMLVQTMLSLHGFGADGHAYWLTAHRTLYTTPPDTRDAYLYSPLFAQVIHPIALLPFPAFIAIVIAVDAGCFAWLLWPLGWQWAVPIMLLMADEFVQGQVIGLITAGAVLGVTGRPGMWSFGWLTKITPGALGLSWFLSRGELRKTVACLAWPAALSVVSYLTWPAAWHAWFALLGRSSGGHSAAVRALVAMCLVAIGGRRSWWWTIALGLAVCAPVADLKSLFYLAALPRLLAAGSRARTERAAPGRSLAAAEPAA